MNFFILTNLLGILLLLGECKPNDHEKKDRSYTPDLSEHEHGGEEDHDSRYDHDAFLGRDEAKRFDELSPDESKERLSKLVDKIDADKDGKVTDQELRNWITQSARRYLIDDRDKQWSDHGLVANDKLTWEIYRKKTFGTDKDEEVDKEGTGSIKEMLARDEKRWKAADKDGDGALSKEEFMDFLHPEEAPHMRDIVIQETMDDIDKNKDGYVDIDEYIKDMWSHEAGESEPDWVKTERDQFTEHKDKNKDGHLDKEEVADWILPKEYDHIESETKHLMEQADANKDGVLTKDEILNKYDVFVGSQATDFGEALNRHDEL